jgi:cytochrome c oxidase subunit II
MDVLPNRYTTTWFQATSTGEAILYCTEYCGTAHSDMLATVHVLSVEEFEEWLETGLEMDEDMPLAEVGGQTLPAPGATPAIPWTEPTGSAPPSSGLFNRIGNWDGSVVVADEDYIRRSILDRRPK